MKKSSELFQQYQEINSQVFKEDKILKGLFDATHSGNRTYGRIHRKEDTSRDISWVDKVNDAIGHMNTIVTNPRSFIKTVSYLVPAELAKRTDSTSITHLSTHSQYVKKIEDDGTIIPSKILTSEGDIDVQIYENRFVMTLLKRLHLYVERRYEFLKKFSELKDMDILYLKNNYKVGDFTIKLKTEVEISTPAEASKDISKKIKEAMDKIGTARQYISFFLNSKFMKEDMKGARPITPPIMQTNLLRSNPDYHALLELWEFLNIEEHATMDFMVDEEIKDISSEEEQRLDFINFLSVYDVLESRQDKSLEFTKNEYHVEVLSDLDEILFLNDKFKPYELVRTDKEYYEDLTKRINSILMDKSESTKRHFFLEEVKTLRNIEIQKQASEELRERKLKQQKELEEKQRLIQEEENRILEENRINEEKRIALEKEQELEELRKQIAQISIDDNRKLPNITLKSTKKKVYEEKFKKQHLTTGRELESKEKRTPLSEIILKTNYINKDDILVDVEAEEAIDRKNRR